MQFKIQAQLLRKRAADIAERWTEAIQDEIPATKGKNPLALLDTLPEFLANLADALECGSGWKKQWESSSSGEDHGRQRFDLSGYSLRQVLSEYRILRRVIIEALFSDAAGITSPLLIVHDAIDRGLANAGESFAAAEREADRQLRDRFVAALTHDLRNPLATAKMAIDLFEPDVAGPAEKHELKAMLMRSLDNVELLVSDLLDVNRVRSGRKLPIVPRHLNFAEIAREVIADFTSVDGPRFALEMGKHVVGYWCPHAIRRLLDNLVANAVKYGAKDRAITIRLWQDRDLTFLAVHNEGAPIAAEDLGALFDPFVRSQSAIKDPDIQHGWGLGLAVVKAVAEAHGGKVTVASYAGDGTTFTVTLQTDARLLQDQQ